MAGDCLLRAAHVKPASPPPCAPAAVLHPVLAPCSPLLCPFQTPSFWCPALWSAVQLQKAIHLPPRASRPPQEGCSEAQKGAWIYPRSSSVALWSYVLGKEALSWILATPATLRDAPEGELSSEAHVSHQPSSHCSGSAARHGSPSSARALLSFAVSVSHLINICWFYDFSGV